ncbi:MAG: hypothetical protein M0T75_06070 [Chloroflexi bacterium]|nr:hypothetical protein [Chloroflexota bacterium]
MGARRTREGADGWRLLRAGAPAGLWAAGIVVVALGDPVGGLALLLAGWFARAAVRAAARREALEALIVDLTVGEVMETTAVAVAPHATLDTFADAVGGAVDGTRGPTVVRVMGDDRLLGLLGQRELARVPRRRWPVVRAGEAMVPASRLPVLAPGEALRPAAERLGASRAPGFPVVAEGRLAGVLTRMAVGRTLHERWLAAAARRDAAPDDPAAGRGRG